MKFKVGEEVNYVGPQSNSYYGGSLTRFSNCTIIVKNIRIDMRGNKCVDVQVHDDERIVRCDWTGKPEYFEPVNNYPEIQTNYKI